MLIVIICFPGYDNAKNFEINFFNVFKGLSVARKCLRPESGSLIIKRKKIKEKKGKSKSVEINSIYVKLVEKNNEI